MKSLESIIWYANRLRAMKPAEMGHRVVEKWRRATEVSFLKSIAGFDPGPASFKVPRLPEKTLATAEMRKQLETDAKRLQRGEWQVFGWRTVEVGAPPCWHRDPVCGVVIDPEKPARCLNHRHLPDDADARTIWEINRWAEVTRLGMHGWLNDDVNALRSAQLWLEDWCDRNPPGMGINWTSPLEVALRLINFAWFDALVQGTGAVHGARGQSVKNAQVELVKRIVPVHAGWAWRYRSAGSSANNHLLGELVALVVAVSRWPALEKITCSAETAWESVSREVLHQFACDGGSKEQALHYHVFAFELAWQAVRAVGCRAGEVHDRLTAAAEYFQSLVHAEAPWDFGDSDDAQVVPVTLKRRHAVAEWRAWMRGEDGMMRFWLGDPPAAKVSATPSEWRVFQDSGMAVMRKSGWMIRCDASPLGFGSLAAHGHADAMHVSLWDGDQALIIDPGTGGYYGHKDLRADLAAWESHNGPLPISGYRSPKRLGVFLWSHPHALPNLTVVGDQAAVRFEHEGYVFQRTIRVHEDGAEIRDAEERGRAFKLRFFLAPCCRVQPGSAKNILSLESKQNEKAWELSFDAQAQMTLTEQTVSPGYGERQTATVLMIHSPTGQMNLTLRRRV